MSKSIIQKTLLVGKRFVDNLQVPGPNFSTNRHYILKK